MAGWCFGPWVCWAGGLLSPADELQVFRGHQLLRMDVFKQTVSVAKETPIAASPQLFPTSRSVREDPPQLAAMGGCGQSPSKVSSTFPLALPRQLVV